MMFMEMVLMIMLVVMMVVMMMEVMEMTVMMMKMIFPAGFLQQGTEHWWLPRPQPNHINHMIFLNY